MTRRPQPFSFWRLLAVTAGLVVGLVALERFAILPAAPWPGESVPHISAAVAALPAGEVASGQPILSLVMEPGDLNDPARGLLTNPFEHGAEWERPGTVAYFDASRLRFATGVGVRIHGGGSRKTSPRQGFRLYFRRQYGARQVPPGVLFSPEAQPLRHLVVHNDVRDGRHFFNPLGYDIARAVGAIAPDTQPVRFFLNGELYGAYVLTERFDQQYFAAHFGHDDVVADQDLFDELWRWTSTTRPLTMDTVAAKVDLDNLTRWFVAVAFSATRDAYQGPGQFLDRATEVPRWFWVAWDMDGSFRAPELDSYRDLLNRVDEGKRGRNAAEPRSTLLSHLFAEDEAFRRYYKRLFVAVMNHRLTSDFLRRRFEYYRRTSERLQVEDRQYLRELETFLERRPDEFWRLTEQWLNSGPSHVMTLSAPAAETITIDGEPARGGFAGRYFPGQELNVHVQLDAGETFAEWRVNGRPAGRDPRLRLTVDGPTAVEAVFTGRSAGPAPTVPLPPIPRAPAPPPAPLRWAALPASGTIPRFSMLAREVSSAEFAAFAERAGQATPIQPTWSEPSHPVVNVTWDEAGAFCAAHGARLPTQSEWEHAADWLPSSSERPPWGDARSRQTNLLGMLDADRWAYTAPAGSFAPNRFGLHDMVGNVWEWTETRHQRSTGEYDERVVLGGSWDTPSRSFPRRAGLSRIGRHNLYVGFRCAR